MIDLSAPRHLNKATLLIGGLESVPGLVLGLPAVAYFVGNVGLGTALGLALVGLALTIGFAWIAWLRFTYWVEDDQLIIESGVLSRNRRNIPFDRIQDISLEQKLLARIFNVSAVKIETGSSGGDEGELRYVSRAEADALRDAVRRFRAPQRAAQTTGEAENIEAVEESAPEPLLFAMSIDRLLVAGLFNFSLVFLAVIGGAFQYVGDAILDRYLDVEYWTGQEGTAILNMVSVLSVVVLTSVLLLIGIISGITRTILLDYGFELRRTETGFRRLRGLFTRTDVVMPIRRVQAAIISTGILRRAFGWQKLAFQSLGTDGGAGTNHEAAPFAKMDELRPILGEITLPLPPQPDAFHSVSKGMVWRTIAEGFVLLAVFMTIVAQFWPGWPMLIGLVALILAWAWLDYQAHGWCVEGNTLFVRSGWWRPRVTILPLAKVQSVTLHADPIHRLMGLANVKIGTAGAPMLSSLTISDMEQGEAKRLMDSRLIPHAASSPEHYSMIDDNDRRAIEAQ